MNLARLTMSFFAFIALACDEPGGNGGGTGTPNLPDGGNPQSGVPDGQIHTPETTPEATPSGTACTDGNRDCPNTVCYCNGSGALPSPVNTHKCVNGFCLTPGTGCNDSCAAFGMAWNGEFEVLPNGNSPNPEPDPDPSGDDDSCEYAFDDECDDASRGGTGYCDDGTDWTDCGR